MQPTNEQIHLGLRTSTPNEFLLSGRPSPLEQMIEARRTWLNFRHNPRAASLFISACLGFFTILLGTNQKFSMSITDQCGNITSIPLLAPPWKRRHLSLAKGECAADPWDNEEPPSFFLDGVSRKKAKEHWDVTRQWRRSHQMGSMLSRPPPKHELLRAMVPQSMYQHDRERNIVIVEQWGKVDIDKIHRHRLKHEDFIHAYTFDLEWLWRVAAPRPTDKITLVMDLGNVTFEQLTSWETIRLIKERIEIGCNHYPNRAAHLLLVNVPDFFSKVFRLAEPLLSPQTKKRILILTEKEVASGAIKKIIHPRQLLPEYAGNCKIPFGHSALDKKLRRHVQKLQRKQG